MDTTTNPLDLDVEKSLLKLAQLEQAASSFESAVDKIKTRHAAELAEPNKMLEAARKQVADLRALIIASERLHVLSTGDKNENGTFVARDSHITIKRKPVAYEYDEAEMIKAIQTHKGKHSTTSKKKLLRIKTELNKVELNKVLPLKDYQWLPAEQASRDVIITINPLGDLLIKAEVDAKNDAKYDVKNDPIPEYVINELVALMRDGYDIRKMLKSVDLIDDKSARWILSNAARYGTAVDVAKARSKQTA